MRKLLLGGAVLLLLLPFCLFAAAEPADDAQRYYDEQLQASGADRLAQSLPEETRALLRELGIDTVDFGALLNASPRALLDLLLSLLRGKAAEPLRAALKMAGILLLLAVAQSLAPQDGKLNGTVRFIGGALLIVSIVSPLAAVLNAAAAALRLSADFMLLLIPALTAVVAAAGNPLLALNSRTLAFSAAQTIAQLADGFLLPLTGLSLAAGIAGTLAPEYKLHSLSQTLHKTAVWALSCAAALFSGFLGLRGVLANAADSMTVRGIKLAMKSAVPIVGGALSEAYASIAGSLSLLKNAIGIFGILALALLNLPVLAELTLWIAALKAASLAAQLLALEGLDELLDGFARSLVLLAVLVLLAALLLMVSTGLVISIRVDQ